MILNNNFELENLQLAGNSAFYGGAVFVSADLSANATFSNLTFIGNTAAAGTARLLLMFSPSNHLLFSIWTSAVVLCCNALYRAALRAPLSSCAAHGILYTHTQ